MIPRPQKYQQTMCSESAGMTSRPSPLKGEHKDICMLILKDLLDVNKYIVVKRIVKKIRLV